MFVVLGGLINLMEICILPEANAALHRMSQCNQRDVCVLPAVRLELQTIHECQEPQSMSKTFNSRGTSFQKSSRRINARVYLPVLLGLFCMVMSLAAGLLLKQGRLQAESKFDVPVYSEIQRPMTRIEVLVPTREVQGGATLTPDMFRPVSLPESQVGRNAIRSFTEVQGFYARTLLIPEQPLLKEYLTPVKPASDVISAIPDGFRAVTIRVDERTGVEGWARAGARVDIVWSSKLNGKPMISVIVENAKVLSAERQVSPQPEEGKEQAPIPTTVTLLVAAEDANRIQLATVSGSMSLSLRGLNDNKSNKVVPLTIDDLLREGRPVSAEDAPRVMLSIKGGKGDRVGYTLKDGQLVPLN